MLVQVICLTLFAVVLDAKSLKEGNGRLEVVEIDDYSDNYYTVNVSIGTPSQIFILKLDTSFSQLLVEKIGCAVDPPFDPTATIGPTTKRQFDPSKSTTAEQTEDYCSLDVWGGGNGYDVRDTIKLGNLTVLSGSACLLHDINYNDHYTSYDGIFGLGLMDENEEEAIMPEIMKELDQPVFTIWLDDRKENRKPETSGGLLTFGGLDSQNCDPNWDLVSLSQNMEWPYEWRVDIETFEIGKYSSTGMRQGRLFSGEKYLYIATSDYHMAITMIGAQFNYLLREYVVSCKRRDSLPKMAFTIGKKDFYISAYEYLYETDVDDLCIVAVYSSNELESPDIWSLGEAFMRAHCIAFDYENSSKVGLSKALKSRT